MKKFFVVAALFTAFVFTACDQAVQSADDPADDPFGNSIALSTTKTVAGVTAPPTLWNGFTPLPFTNNPGITSVSNIATDGTYLVATGFIGEPNNVPYASRYDLLNNVWSSPANLSTFFTVKPGAVHYLNGTFLVTGGTTSTYGAYSQNGSNWIQTSSIGFGTKAGVYGPAEQIYVVAGQNGQAAYTSNLTSAFVTVPQTVTGWSGTGGTAYINAGAYGNGTYVFGGGSGRIAYTNTIRGKTPTNPWSTAQPATGKTFPFGLGDFVDAIAYGGNKTFVAVGDSSPSPGVTVGIIAVSTNGGLNWDLANTLNAPNIGSSAGIFALTYGDGYFVAMDNNGYSAQSNNGVNWTDITTNNAFVPADNPRVNTVVFYDAANKFFAAGDDNGNVQIGASD
jgi:hypothetical protein